MKPIDLDKRERYITTLIGLLHEYWLGSLDELLERIRAEATQEPLTVSLEHDDVMTPR